MGSSTSGVSEVDSLKLSIQYEISGSQIYPRQNAHRSISAASIDVSTVGMPKGERLNNTIGCRTKMRHKLDL